MTDRPHDPGDAADPEAGDNVTPGQWWPNPPVERVTDGVNWWDADPRIPSPEEAAQFRPAQDLFLATLDTISEATLGRPLKPRLKVSPAGLLRGEIDMVKVEVPAYALAGLVIDRFIIRAKRVRIQPGLPPTLIAEPVQLRAIVSQDNVDRWISNARLPFRLELTADGILTTTGFGGIRVSEILTVPDVVGGFLKLQPRRVSLLGVPAPMARFLRGYLPLPPLPRSAKLEEVQNRDGELEVGLIIDRFEQRLTPDVQNRLTKLLRLPLPGLG